MVETRSRTPAKATSSRNRSRSQSRSRAKPRSEGSPSCPSSRSKPSSKSTSSSTRKTLKASFPSAEGVFDALTEEDKKLIKESFKKYELDELADRFFHRPLAHFIVKAIVKLRLKFITPNHITLGSLISGLGAALYMAQTLSPIDLLPNWMPWKSGGECSRFAAFLMCTSMTWDCADGQLARATNQSSPLGRFYDGICDTLVIASYSGVFVVSCLRHDPSLYLQGGDLKWYFLALCFGVSMQQHFILFDKVKIVYILQTSPKNDKGRKEFEDCVSIKKLEKLKKDQTTMWGKIIYGLAIWYADSLSIDPKSPFFKHRGLDSKPELKREIELTMRMLSFLGSGTMIMHWYIMLLLVELYPQVWKAFIVFQLTVVNFLDIAVRRRALRLSLHQGPFSELKSALPFLLIGIALGVGFSPLHS